jgi:uncharacterized membrane protein YhaH (DUF805 family)
MVARPNLRSPSLRSQSLRSFLSPSGRLSPQSFLVAVVLVYGVAVASQALTLRDVIKVAGLWPFLVAQLVLVWIWYVLHARRLRDAGKSAGIAVAVSLLYGLSVALLVIVAGAFYGALAGENAIDPNATGALNLILFVSVVAMLSGMPHDSLAWLIVAVLLLIAYAPIVLALATTVWAATRPRIGEAAA